MHPHISRGLLLLILLLQLQLQWLSLLPRLLLHVSANAPAAATEPS
jgi:hypothetical protein